MYFQLHRHLCILSLVCLILSFLLYLWVLTTTWTAILICLEHSFWIAQQASSSNDGFIKPWKYYLKTQRALVDEELDEFLRSTGSNDWFTVKHSPSEKECAEYRRIVLNNLLCESSSCLLPWLELLIYFSPFQNLHLIILESVGIHNGMLSVLQTFCNVPHLFNSVATSVLSYWTWSLELEGLFPCRNSVALQI